MCVSKAKGWQSSLDEKGQSKDDGETDREKGKKDMLPRHLAYLFLIYLASVSYSRS